MLSIASRALGPIVVGVFVVGIGLSMVLGLWVTESTKVPVSFTSGEFAGQYNPADIRGSYSFADVEAAFEVPVQDLAVAFGVTDVSDPAAFQAKNLEEIYGVQIDGGEVGTDALRYFTALYAGLPYVPEESTRLPETAYAVLEDRLAKADLAMLETRLVPVDDLLASTGTEVARTESPADATQPAATSSDSSVESVAHDEDAIAVKGTTTFGDLLDWGLTREQIEEVIGFEMPIRAASVREAVTSNGLSFSTYRTRLQELLDTRSEL